MSRNTISLFYGPRQVTTGAVLDAVAKAIDNRQDFKANNEAMGGDTLVGVPKIAMIYYALAENPKIFRARSAKEGGVFSFGTDIESITYGNKTITDQTVYIIAYNAFTNGNAFQITNTSMAGDPQPTVLKTAKIVYWRGGTKYTENVQEGSFAKWGLSI
jgi:hypothetical protein